MKLIALLLASASVSLLSACVGERSLEETAVFVSAKMSDASAVDVKNLPAVLASEQASRRPLRNVPSSHFVEIPIFHVYYRIS